MSSFVDASLLVPWPHALMSGCRFGVAAGSPAMGRQDSDPDARRGAGGYGEDE